MTNSVALLEPQSCSETKTDFVGSYRSELLTGYVQISVCIKKSMDLCTICSEYWLSLPLVD